MILSFALHIYQNHMNLRPNLDGKLDKLFLLVLLIKRNMITGPSHTNLYCKEDYRCSKHPPRLPS